MSIDNVQDITPRVQYVASGGQTVFPYPFPIFDDGDLVVDVDGVVLVITTNYTVSGAGGDNGGSVTLTAGATAGQVVTIYRDIAIARDTDFQQNGPWRSAAINDELDRMTLIDQQLELATTRALRVNVNDEADFDDLVLPGASARASRFLAFGATGKPVVSAGTGADAGLREDIATGAAGAVTFVDTVAEMKALTGLVNNAAVMPLGYASTGDFQMRWRRFVQTGTPPADDGGAVIHDTAGAGYYSLDNAVCFDLREYGVDGDDTDDSAQIQKAITKLDSGTGGKLVVTSPPVRYRITATPLTIDGDVNLTIQGQGMPEFRTNYSGTNAITAGSGPSTHQGFVTLSEVALWGDGSSVNGFKGNYLANLKLYSLSLYQLGGIGVYVDNCYTFRLENTQINDCGITGAYVTGASMNGAAVIGSKFLNHNTGAGIGLHIEGPTAPGFHYGGLIGWCDFEFNTVGIKAKDCSGLTIANTYFEENTHHILVSAASNVDNIAIRDCQFLGPGKVELNDISGVTLDNLVFWGTGEVLTLNNCSNIKWGRLYFPNGGTIGGTSLSKYEYQAFSAWQSFATTWTASGSNPSLGDGTLDCYWMRDGNTCTVRYVLTVGAATTFGTGTWRFSTPFTAKTQSGAAWLGNAHYRDSSVPAESFDLACRVSSGGTFVAIFNQSGTGVTGTSPITWATGDQLWVQITFETA